MATAKMTLTLTLKMTNVVETSVNNNKNSPVPTWMIYIYKHVKHIVFKFQMTTKSFSKAFIREIIFDSF